MTQRLTFLLAVLTLLTALLAGCGGQEDTAVEESEATSEVTSEVPVESLPTEADDVDVEVCQTQEAYADLGPAGLRRLSDELSEEVSAGRFANMQEALASRGYTCNGQVQ